MADYTREQLISALRKADAAGDTEAAKAIARRIQAMEAPPPRERAKPNGKSFGELFKQGIKEGAGDIVQSVGDTVGMALNPIGQALYNATGYGDQKYDTGKILREAVGLPQSAPGIGRTMRQAAVGALTMGGAARLAGAAASPGVAKEVLKVVGRTPVRDTVAGAGAGAGSVIGGGVGERIGGRTGRVVGQTAGTLAGGVVGYGAANAMMPRPRVPTPQAQAAQRQGVDMLPADAGGTASKIITSGTKVSPISAGPVVRAAQKIQGQMADAATRVARSQGDDLTADVAGESIKKAAQRFTKQTSQRAARLYDRAAEAAKDITVKPAKTIAAIDDELARLAQNPDPSARSAVKELRALRRNISGGVSVQGLRDARTSLSQGVYNGQLRSGADQARFKSILSNIADDIDTSLTAAGKPGAAKMFRTADKFWKERVEHIDKVLQPIVGKDGAKGGEQVVKAVESMARGGQGGNRRLSQLLSNMTKEEAGQVRATIVDRLGKATPGAQDAAGDVFSANTFLTNWNKMTPQAKSTLFAEKGLRQNLDDLALLAEKQKAAGAMSNFSNTALSIGGNVGTIGYLAANHPVAAAFGAATQYATGKLMASPGFARILAKTAKLPPEAARRVLTEQIGVLAAREPIIAADASRFLAALNDNVGNAAVAEQPSQ